MNQVVIALALFMSLTSFAQEMSPQNFTTGKAGVKSESAKKEMLESYFAILNAIDMIEEQKIADLRVTSGVTGGQVALNDFATEKYQDKNYRNRLEAALAKLIEKDPMNWLPVFQKYLRQLANASVALRDFAAEQEVASVNMEDLKGWQTQNQKLNEILSAIESGQYAERASPGPLQGFISFFNRN